MISFTELQAQHAVDRTQRAEAKRAFRTQHEHLIADNDEHSDKEQAAADAAHTAEVERRLRATQKGALDTLTPLVKAWLANDGRIATKAIVDAYAALDADAKRDTGVGLASLSLAYAFVRVSLEAHPERAGWWCQVTAYANGFLNCPAEVSQTAARAALAANVAALRESLLKLESCIEAGGGQGLTDHVERRLDIVMTGGSPKAVADQLAALKAERLEEDRARVQRAVTEYDREQANNRARDGYAGLMPANLGAAMDQALNRVIGRPRAGA
jgi:hypothetical protein